ncbi:hypothetical protein AB0G02_06715 [Actinosynnema sp. NPDC023658]|uniref:hypothetical protein n=1 Tax=Actinosynnema sp. NPDC023658 TaxID=3155465 RepID=UPI0033D2A0F1
MNAKNQIGALPLALCCAALYAVVAGAAGYLVLDERTPAPVAVSAPTVPSITTEVPPTTTAAPASTTTALPADLRRVDAPGGLTTVIPADWAITPGTVATTLVATDPASPRREVRLGGAPVADASKPLLDRITEAAEGREREAGHRRLSLTATTIRNHPAVGWEFEESAPADPERVATAFWESNGVEYVLYSAGPPEEWDLTRSRLARMVELATP